MAAPALVVGGNPLETRHPMYCTWMQINEVDINQYTVDTAVVVTDVTMQEDMQAITTRRKQAGRWAWRAFTNGVLMPGPLPPFPIAGFDIYNFNTLVPPANNLIDVPGGGIRARAKSILAGGMTSKMNLILTRLQPNPAGDRISRRHTVTQNNTALGRQRIRLRKVYRAILKEAYTPSIVPRIVTVSTGIALPLIGVSPQINYDAEQSARAAIEEILDFFAAPFSGAARRAQITTLILVVPPGRSGTKIKIESALRRIWREEVETLPPDPATPGQSAERPVRRSRDARRLLAENNNVPGNAQGLGAYNV